MNLIVMIQSLRLRNVALAALASSVSFCAYNFLFIADLRPPLRLTTQVLQCASAGRLSSAVAVFSPALGFQFSSGALHSLLFGQPGSS